MKFWIFRPNFIHSSDLTCHSTCPLPQRILLSRGRTVSTSHFLGPVALLGGSAIKRYTKQTSNIENPHIGSRVILTFMGPTAYLCSALLWCETATGAKTITLPETLWKSHLSVTFGGRFASAKRFCLFWSPSSQEKSIFHEISACETYHGCNHANLGAVQSFSVSYGLS